jgi:2-dehydropantoate 2-reductase
MGCGAIGGALAAALLEHGHNVTIVTRNEAISETLTTEGLRVITPQGTHVLPAKVCAGACPGLDDVSGPFDIVLMAMKATHVVDAARDAVDRLAPDGVVVTLQNGIVEDSVAAIVGQRRVIGAIVGWGASMHAPGTYEVTSRGETIIGELDGSVTDRVEALKTILDAAAPTEISANIYGALWSKLAINCVVTTLGALTGLRLGEMLRKARVRKLALGIISEVVDTARSQGVTLEPVSGTLDLEALYLPPDRRDVGFTIDMLPKHAIMMIVGLKFRKLRSSMLQSMERGRPPEIDYMNGYVVERAQQSGVATPLNSALVEMVWAIAAGKNRSRPENLDQLAP